MLTAVALIASLAVLVAGPRQSPQTPPAATQPPATQPPPTQPAQKPPARKPAPARPTTMTVVVTDMEGKPLPEVWVKASGPVDREAPTDDKGSVTFRNVSAGSYRLRFEHDEYVTLEREVTVQTRALATTVALTRAPAPPPEPEKPEPAPAPSPTLPPAGPSTFVSIPDFVERHYVGNASALNSPVGCAPSATSTLLQLREPLAEHQHAEADEMLYVVAGEGTHRVAGRDIPLEAGVFAVVPRGTAHAITRRGSRPIIVLSILSGEPCAQK